MAFNVTLYFCFIAKNCLKPCHQQHLNCSLLGITFDVRASNCNDRGLPKTMSTNKNCKRLKLSCAKLRSKCNGKLGSSLGNSASAKKCKKKLPSWDKNILVKYLCTKSCKECGKPSYHLSK